MLALVYFSIIYAFRFRKAVWPIKESLLCLRFLLEKSQMNALQKNAYIIWGFQSDWRDFWKNHCIFISTFGFSFMFENNLKSKLCLKMTLLPMFRLLQVFLKGPSLYAFKGLAGRFAPIGVHLAMLLIMAGGTLSATGSFRGSVTVPQGLNFVIGDVLGPNGFLSTPTEAFNTEVHVNRFSMDYYDSGEVRSHKSDRES